MACDVIIQSHLATWTGPTTHKVLLINFCLGTEVPRLSALGVGPTGRTWYVRSAKCTRVEVQSA